MYKVPKWISAIPHNPKSHGTGNLQKKLWKLCSDYTRIRDWYDYNGRCVATGKYIEHWSMGDPGHYLSYSICNSMFKFDIWNIHLQSKSSNGWGGMADGYSFGEELKRRYGEEFLEELRKENMSWMGKKVDNQMIVNEMIEILDLMASLPEKPDYYEKVLSKINMV